MDAIVIGCLTFLVLSGAALGSLTLHGRLSSPNLHDDTNTTLRLVANIFVVMASLLLGLMANGARTTYETANGNLHAFANDLILLDRTVAALGPTADRTRAGLRAYVHRSIDHGPVSTEDPEAERLLVQAAASLAALPTVDAQSNALWSDARKMMQETVRQRWVIVDRTQGRMPYPIIAMLLTWLVLIYVSFGYRAPRNTVVVASFVGSALLLSISLYLILDMSAPFSGAIQVSDRPMHRALAEMMRTDLGLVGPGPAA